MLALTLRGSTQHLPESDREDAMRRFWDARQAGDLTANLERIEELAPANTPMPEPDNDPPPATPGGAVSSIAFERIERQDTWARDAGFALKPPVYAPGTRVLPVGDQNFRTERCRLEELPRFQTAASYVTRAIEKEAREDVTVELTDVAMTHQGALVLGTREYELEHLAFLQLASHANFAMGARYLAERCDRALRADNVNAQLAKHPDHKLVFRTRQGPEGQRPRIYAAVSTGYAAVDSDTVLEAVTPALYHAHGELVYDGSGITATALYMPDHVVDLAAGDIFKAGVRVRTDDTGRGRIKIAAVLWRNRCLNLLIIDEGEVETVSEVHRGDPARILAAVRSGVETAQGKIGNFLDAWGKARQIKVDPMKQIEEWVAQKKVTPRTERERDQLVQALLDAWQKEPGDTLADAVNAVSRAAHEEHSFPMDFREQLERQAARLVLLPR